MVSQHPQRVIQSSRPLLMEPHCQPVGRQRYQEQGEGLKVLMKLNLNCKVQQYLRGTSHTPQSIPADSCVPRDSTLWMLWALLAAKIGKDSLKESMSK